MRDKKKYQGLPRLLEFRKLKVFRLILLPHNFPLFNPTQSLCKKHSFSPYVLLFLWLAIAPKYQNAFGVL